MAPQQAVLITDELTVECTSATLTSTGVITKHADQRLRNKKSMPVKKERDYNMQNKVTSHECK